MREGQIHIFSGRGVTSTSEIDTNTGKWLYAELTYYTYMRRGKTEWVGLIIGPAVTLSFDFFFFT